MLKNRGKYFTAYLFSIFFLSFILCQVGTSNVAYAKEASTGQNKGGKETNVTELLDSPSLAVFPHNNQGKQYSDWKKESEVGVSVHNIPVTLTKGKKGVSIYIPKNKLSDGQYQFLLSIGNSATNNISRLITLTIKNGKLIDHSCKEYEDGYVVEVVMDYEEEIPCSSCIFTVRLASSAVKEDDCFYIGNMWYEDEKIGRYELDLADERLEFSSRRYHTSEVRSVYLSPSLQTTKKELMVVSSASVYDLEAFHSTSLAIFPYNNQGKKYKDWKVESEVIISIYNIPVALTKGNRGVSIYIPKNKLSDGEYQLQLSYATSYAVLIYDFFIKNGKLDTDSFSYIEYEEGYVAELILGYASEGICNHHPLKVKLSTTAVKSENCIYMGNIWYEDEQTGRYELDLEDNRLEIVSRHFMTSEEHPVYISYSLQTPKEELMLIEPAVLVEKKEIMVGNSYVFVPKDFLNQEGKFIWVSSNPSVGTIEQITGKFTALKEGKTTIHLINYKQKLHHTFEVTVSALKQKDVKDYITVVGNNVISKELEQKVTAFLYKIYPEIYHSFANDEYEKITVNFINFSKDAKDAKDRGSAGYTVLNQVYVDAEYINEHSEDLEYVLIHELVHCAQHYLNGRGWLTEGIADYGYYLSGYYNEQSMRALIPYREGLHYTNGYRVTANFLKYVVECHNKDTVTILNQCCRNDVYSDDIWEYCTGYTLDELWELYAVYSENSVE